MSYLSDRTTNYLLFYFFDSNFFTIRITFYYVYIFYGKQYNVINSRNAFWILKICNKNKNLAWNFSKSDALE